MWVAREAIMVGINAKINFHLVMAYLSHEEEKSQLMGIFVTNTLTNSFF